MKKVYKYRNISSIDCTISNAPVGFTYKDYPEIKEKRHRMSVKEDIATHWVLFKHQSTGKYNISVSFKEKMLTCHKMMADRPYNYSLHVDYDWYYHIEDERVATASGWNNAEASPDYFTSKGTPMELAKNYLVKIKFDKLKDFSISLKDLKKVEYRKSWFSSTIILELHFSKSQRNGLMSYKLLFDKEDKEIVEFLIDEINSVMKVVESEERQKLIEQWSEEAPQE